MKKSLLLILFISFCGLANANNMLVQNVTTTGDNPGAQTIQVQFDISWDNSWRDAINWDAAWIFMKFKDANGLWQHCKLNQTGFTNGSGTANTVQVTADNIGSWLYRSALGSGSFNTTGMQLQWNYGLSGLTNVTGLEIRVFAVEMVYVPEGDFNCAKNFQTYQTNFNDVHQPIYSSFNASGSNFPVINSKLTPTLSYSDGSSASVRIKGNAGIDTDNDGTVDNTTYPTGYRAFYAYKYELSEQQYADFLNTLSAFQIATLGIAGTQITLTNGQYFSSTPNKACINSTSDRFFAFADWSGLRPMTFLEVNKASYGPLQPVYYTSDVSGYAAGGSEFDIFSYDPVPYSTYFTEVRNVGSYANDSTTRAQSGASYYGLFDLTGNATELIIKLNYFQFNNTNGNGLLNINGTSDISNWSVESLVNYDQVDFFIVEGNRTGFRYVRSAE
jgi:hypothetical protein